MGKYSVIKLSLKGAKQSDYFTSFLSLRHDIILEYERHLYVKDSQRLNERERALFRKLWLGEEEWEARIKQFASEKERNDAAREEIGKYVHSLEDLSYLLKKHFGRNAIILINEYDVPLENAWQRGFYDEMVDFIRSLFRVCTENG